MATTENNREKRYFGTVRGSDAGDGDGLLGITIPVANTWRVPADKYIQLRNVFFKTVQEDFVIDNSRSWQLRFSMAGNQFNPSSPAWLNVGSVLPTPGQFYLVDFGTGAAARTEIIKSIWDSYEQDIVVAQQYWPDINGVTTTKFNVEL